MSSDQKIPELSIVVPVYNEETRIGECLRRLEAFLSLKNWEWEVIVSSDGSTDQTESLVRKFSQGQKGGRITFIPFAENMGKGAAVRRGMNTASGKYILMTDADLSTPIKEVDKLIAALEKGYDVAMGSRALREEGCDVQQSFKRWFAGRIYNCLVQAIVLKGFSDTQCGFKCFKKAAARTLFQAQTINGFGFDVEILCLAKKMGLKIKEVPVMWREAKGSKVSLFKHSPPMVKELFYLRKHYS